jgi:hypothetical protein
MHLEKRAIAMREGGKTKQAAEKCPVHLLRRCHRCWNGQTVAHRDEKDAPPMKRWKLRTRDARALQRSVPLRKSHQREACGIITNGIMSAPSHMPN